MHSINLPLFMDEDGKACHYAEPVPTEDGMEIKAICGADTSNMNLMKLPSLGLWVKCRMCQMQVDFVLGID